MLFIEPLTEGTTLSVSRVVIKPIAKGAAKDGASPLLKEYLAFEGMSGKVTDVILQEEIDRGYGVSIRATVKKFS